ncbi:MAG: ABC transporter permease subunit, partial [Candidatus Dormibacteraeota bacterium]|nr:ABC transporter permease subunit [Candidatus Dormibacteraeota bacterium]
MTAVQGLPGALRAELLKTGKRASPWVLLGISLAILVILSYGVAWLIYTHPPPGTQLPRGATAAQLKQALYPAGFVQATLSNGLPGVLALILGVLLVGSEFSWGTLKTLFTQRPGRLETLAAKILALAVAVAVGVLAMFAMAAVCSVLIAVADGHTLADWPSTATIVKGLLVAWLIWGWWALFGAALSVIFRQAALAIGLGLAYSLVIEGLVFGIVGSLGGSFFENFRKFFPGPNASALQQSFSITAAARQGAQAAQSGSIGISEAAMV